MLTETLNRLMQAWRDDRLDLHRLDPHELAELHAHIDEASGADESERFAMDVERAGLAWWGVAPEGGTYYLTADHRVFAPEFDTRRQRAFQVAQYLEHGRWEGRVSFFVVWP